MTSFEQYLVNEKGFHQSDNKDVLVSPNGYKFIFGLSEHGKPRTLICPRPLIMDKTPYQDNKTFQFPPSDDSMNLILMNIDNDVIFKAIESCVRKDRKMAFVVNNDRSIQVVSVEKNTEIKNGEI